MSNVTKQFVLAGRSISGKRNVTRFCKLGLKYKSLAEVMGITLEEALTERDLRLAQQADAQARKQRQLATY